MSETEITTTNESQQVLTNNKQITVFQVHAIKNNNKARLDFLGILNKEQEFMDEELIYNNESLLEIMPNIYVKFYKTNMLGEYVMSSKKLPVMSASVFYEKGIIKGYLFSVYIYFTIKSNTKKITSLNDLLKKKLRGQYTTELVVDNNDENKTQEVINMDKFEGYEETCGNILKFLELEEMKIMINEEMRRKEELRRKQYGDINEFKPPTEIKYNFDELLRRAENGENIDDLVKQVYN
jgi:hypothetical protein